MAEYDRRRRRLVRYAGPPRKCARCARRRSRTLPSVGAGAPSVPAPPGRRRIARYAGARRVPGCWARLSHRCGGPPPDLGEPVQAACEGVCGSGGGSCTDAAVVHESGARECSGATVSHSSRRVGQGAVRTPPQHVGAPDAPVHLAPRRSQGRSASPSHRSGPSWRRRRPPAGDAERLRPGPNPDKLGAAKMANRFQQARILLSMYPPPPRKTGEAAQQESALTGGAASP